MTHWEFTLIVDGPDIQGDNGLLDALFEAGCDDALVGRTNCVQYLAFTREAACLEDAVLSAVADIESVSPLQVTRLIDSDLVSMSEIAERTGRTRESIRLLVNGERGPGGFPVPATDPRRPHRVWRWSEVENWMQTALGGEPQPDQDDDLLVALAAALAVRHHFRRLDPIQQERVRSLFAA